MTGATRNIVLGVIGVALLAFGIYTVVSHGRDVVNLGYGSIFGGAIFLGAAIIFTFRGGTSR